MSDTGHLTGLADIVGPQAPAMATASSGPSLLIAGALVLLLLLITVWLGYRHRHGRRRRTLLRLLDRPVPTTPERCAVAAAEISAALRALLPESHWPPALRACLDALRYAPQPDPTEMKRLQHRLAATLRERWWSAALNPDRRHAARLADETRWP